MYINGPNIFIELINEKSQKNIVLFGDYHINPSSQDECNNIESIRIDKFLHNFFKNTKKEIDFYIELSKEKYDNSKNNKFHMLQYIFIMEKFYIDHKDNYPNVKFHIGDIRSSFYVTDGLLYHINMLIDIFSKCIYQNENIISNISYLKENSLKFAKLLNFDEKYDIKAKTDFNLENSNFLKYYNELKNNYLHDRDKKIVHKMIKKIKCAYLKIIDLLTNFEIKYKKYLHHKTTTNYYNNCSNTYMKQHEDFICDNEHLYLSNKLEFISSQILNIYSRLMDFYLIKKISENNNKNIILYTGLSHTLFITTVLIKKYNYKIINYSKHSPNIISPINNISDKKTIKNKKTTKNEIVYLKKLNKNIINSKFNYINESKYLAMIFPLYYDFDFYPNQCVDVGNVLMFKTKQ